MEIRLNKLQRRAAIGTAAIIGAIQLVGIWENGLDENRGWMWALLVAGVLLVVGLASHGGDAGLRRGESSDGHDRTAVTSPRATTPAAVMAEFQDDMSRALALVTTTAAMASRIRAGTKHQEPAHDGVLAMVLDPDIHASLAAHACLLAERGSVSSRREGFVWSTYETTLANRLAERRLSAFMRMIPRLDRPGDAAGREELRKSALDLVRAEMGIWSGLVEKQRTSGTEACRTAVLAHMSLTFAGKQLGDGGDPIRELHHEMVERARSGLRAVAIPTGQPN